MPGALISKMKLNRLFNLPCENNLLILPYTCMKFAFKHIILRCLVFFMAIQVLNFSIDSVEFHPLSCANTVGDFNYMNSMVEYFSEIVMGNTNAFPEYNQKNTSGSQNIKHVNIKIYKPVDLSFTINHEYLPVISYGFTLDESYSFLFSKEINPPPQKA